ncbi:hypothetical protein ABPG72_001400 [Tetrahymena utriculariae]
MNSQDLQQKNIFQNQIYCSIHINCLVIAFQTQAVQKNQLKCIQCIIEENISGSSLLSIQEMCSSSQQTIFGNWPPLKNKFVLQEINQILLNDKNDKQNVFQKIRSYFDDFRQRLEVKMQQIENEIAQRAKQYLISCQQITTQYNNSAEKEYLQQLFINQNQFQYDEINQQIQSIVKSKIQKQDKNLENLKKVVESFISSNKIIYFSLPQSFKDDILGQLSKLEVVSYSAQLYQREQGSKINKELNVSKDDALRYNLDTFYNLQQEQLNDLIQLMNKIIEIDNQNMQECNQENNNWGNLRQNSYKIYTALKQSHFCSESKSAIKKILQKYPVFDLLSPISIDLHNRNQSVKLTNQYQLIMSNNQEYQQGKIDINSDGKYFLEKSSHNGYCICYSNIFFNPKEKYIVRVQIDKNSDQDWIVVGLMADSLKDKSTLYEQQICYHYGYGDLANQKVLKGQNLQLDQLKKGESKILELRICIQDKLFVISDYPKHESVTQISNEPKSPFHKEENYRFSIAMYNSSDKVTLLDVEVVQQFNSF